MEIGHDYWCSTTLKALHSEEPTSADVFWVNTLRLPACPKHGSGWPRTFYSRHAMESCDGEAWVVALQNLTVCKQLPQEGDFFLCEHVFISKALRGENVYNRLPHRKWSTCISLKVTVCKCRGCFHIQGFPKIVSLSFLNVLEMNLMWKTSANLN